jgi:hypothetical protein
MDSSTEFVKEVKRLEALTIVLVENAHQQVDTLNPVFDDVLERMRAQIDTVQALLEVGMELETTKVDVIDLDPPSDEPNSSTEETGENKED